MTTALLENANLVVVGAKDGQECLALGIAHRFGLILMDIKMPVMNGLDAAIAIRKMSWSARLPVVAMTAGCFEEECSAYLAAGMNGYLIKPVEPGLLYAKVLNWLKRMRA